MIHVHQPTDKFFRKTFSKKKSAVVFLEKNLPHDLLAVVELSTLSIADASFVRDDLSEARSDIIYEILFKDRSDKLFVIVEQQSRPDEDMPFRLPRYTLELMDRERKQRKDRKYPLVFFMVLYCGTKKYSVPQSLLKAMSDPSAALFRNPDLASKYMLTSYELIDLSCLSANSLLAQGELGLAQAVLKYSQSLDYCEMLESHPAIVEAIGRAVNPDQYFFYIAAKDPHNIERLLKKFSKLPPKIINKFMSALQKFAEENKQEGILLGVQKGEIRGIEKGKIQERKKIISALKAYGIDPALFEKVTKE